MSAAASRLGWSGIARLGLVQAALGAVVVLTTTVLNRIMVVELALPAVVPGALVAAHYAVQMLRPRWGHGSDGSGRRTPWILGGMAALSLGGTGAALAVAVMAATPLAGLALALLSYLLVGAGVGAAGTSLLTLAATRVAPERRAAAASLIWIMMIAGFAVTAGTAGTFLSPFSMERLVAVVGSVSGLAMLVSAAALFGLEGHGPAPAAPVRAEGSHGKKRCSSQGFAPLQSPVDRSASFRGTPDRPAFRAALAAVWAEPAARRFALFVFTATLAYGSQDLVLDPFAGRILGLSPGDTTRLSGLQHGGALAGMLAVALAGALGGGRHRGFLRAAARAGCVLSALVLCGLAAAEAFGPAFPLRPAVALLGFGNGAFAVAAIGAMMALAGAEGPDRAGLRMGLFGGAQALAFGLGAVAAPLLVDGATALLGSPAPAYAAVFAAEALLFLLSARLVAAAASPGAAAATPDAPFVTVSA